MATKADPEKVRARVKRWQERNPEKVREIRRQWAKEHPEKIREYNKRQAEKNPQKAAERYRRTKLRRNYGITPELYEQMLVAQHGLCAICRRTCRTGMRLAVDHDHLSGKIRGLLCSACNTALGIMEDDILRLKAAMEYLEKAKT